MILLLDIGNTHTHLGLANDRKVLRQATLRTSTWATCEGEAHIRRFVLRNKLSGAALCSVVPKATPLALQSVRKLGIVNCLKLTPRTLRGVGISYPRPRTIGPDRLANAAAAKHHFGAPVVVVDFGTAVTFDVVNRAGDYVGGIIAPGLAAMTDYLHEKTALLPRIRIREVPHVIGRSTREAMLIGAVHGYRGLVRELILELKRALRVRQLAVVATGGYGGLMAAGLPEITKVAPDLTLEGLRLVWLAHRFTGAGNRTPRCLQAVRFTREG